MISPQVLPRLADKKTIKLHGGAGLNRYIPRTLMTITYIFS